MYVVPCKVVVLRNKPIAFFDVLVVVAVVVAKAPYYKTYYQTLTKLVLDACAKIYCVLGDDAFSSPTFPLAIPGK